MNQGLVALMGWVFDALVKQSWLQGYRMYVGGASSILGGVILVLDMVAGGHFSNEKAGAAWAAIAFGYTVIGQAGKQDKIAAALKSPGS
jgi:hypothetical protein